MVDALAGPAWVLLAVAVFVTEPRSKSAWVSVYIAVHDVDCPGVSVRPARAGLQLREVAVVSTSEMPVRLPPPLLAITMV